jgi:replication factor A1
MQGRSLANVLINSLMVSCMLCLYHVVLCIWLLTLQTMGDSGTSLDVVLWGERATAFPAEQVHRDGKATPTDRDICWDSYQGLCR